MRKLHPMIAAFAAVTIAFSACAEQPAEEAETEEAAADAVDHEAAIQDLATTFEDRWAARDWDGVLALYTADFQEVNPEGEVMDLAALESSMRDSTNQPPEGARLDIEFETLEVGEAGDIAYGSGTTTFTATGPDGQEMTGTDHWVAGFENVDGVWKVDRLAIVTAGGAMGDDADGGAMDDGAMEAGGEDSSM